MPELRWPHDHRRDLRAWLDAAHPSVEPDQDRHIMMLRYRTRRPIAARPCRWPSTGEGEARLNAVLAHPPAGHSDIRADAKSLALLLRPRWGPSHAPPTRPIKPTQPQRPAPLSP